MRLHIFLLFNYWFVFTQKKPIHINKRRKTKIKKNSLQSLQRTKAKFIYYIKWLEGLSYTPFNIRSFVHKIKNCLWPLPKYSVSCVFSSLVILITPHTSVRRIFIFFYYFCAKFFRQFKVCFFLLWGKLFDSDISLELWNDYFNSIRWFVDCDYSRKWYVMNQWTRYYIIVISNAAKVLKQNSYINAKCILQILKYLCLSQ